MATQGNTKSIPTGTGIISNRQFIDNDTSERVDKYIDEICSDPVFLCKNRQMCGTSTSIYTGVANVDEICHEITESNKCENDIQQCVVLANNTFDDAQSMVSTSFVNIIVPITNVVDALGNQKFLRLPPLSGSKVKNSNEVCSICACMDRFSKSPGAGTNNDTSPGQNQCVYDKSFEYYYYPLYIEDINNKLKDAPVIKLGKYNVITSNIIYANSSEDLLINNLYDLLIKNGISKHHTIEFITNILYRDNPEKLKELQLYILNKKEPSIINTISGTYYKNIASYFIIFIVFVLLIIYFIKVV
jgi:hypothetical protein